MTGRLIKTVAVLAAGVTAACSDTSALGPSDGMGDVTLTLQRTAVLAADALTDASVFTAAPGGKVPADQVKSLKVTITNIEMLKDCEADEGSGDGVQSNGECQENGGWIPFELEEPLTVDFMALPEPHETPVVIAAGAVPVGTYRNVRLFVEDEVVVFAQTFTIGNSEFEMDTEYPVFIPSGDQTGIKTDLSFTVTEDDEGNEEEVNLLFDTEATFRGVTATGSGKVLLPPVLKAKSTESA